MRLAAIYCDHDKYEIKKQNKDELHFFESSHQVF